MTRGEVWTLARPDGARYRAVVVSSDGHNAIPGAWPYVVPIVHRASGPLPALAVDLVDVDPIGGVALVDELYPVDPRSAVELVGMLTGGTLARVSAAITDLFDL